MSIVLIDGIPTDVGNGADEIIKLRAENTRLRDELATAQATIEQMRGAIGAWERADGNEELQEAEAKLIAAMNAPTNLDALHEALAKECERLAKTHGVGVMKWLCEEAAAHRARKEGK